MEVLKFLEIIPTFEVFFRINLDFLKFFRIILEPGRREDRTDRMVLEELWWDRQCDEVARFKTGIPVLNGRLGKIARFLPVFL